MPNLSAAALTADLPRTQVAGRALNSFGVAFMTGAVAIVCCACLPAVERTGLGLLIAAAMVAGAEVMSRLSKNNTTLWTSSSIMAGGYGLAFFIAQASYYVGGISSLTSPYACWLIELGLAAVALLHTSRNSVLRWAALPFTFLLSGNVLVHALSSTDTITFAGFTTNVSAAASVIGMLYLAALCALYKKLELRFTSESSQSSNEYATRIAYRVAHETYFFLAALNALALPYFCNSVQYAPLWWALELPVLLALCWRSSSFIKHGLIMAVWVLSAVLLLLNKMELDPIVRMAVPLSGFAMACAYRFLNSSWAKWQKVTGYSLYMYGAVAVALAVPALQLGVVEALPYFLAEAGLLVALSLVLSDRVIQRVATVAGIAALGLFAARWQTWNIPLAASVAVGCYATSLLYGWVKKKGGWAKSDFVPVPGAQTLSAQEAGWLEIGSAVAGYLTLMGASFVLFPNPMNTIAWGAEAFSLIAFGFLTNKVGHRFSGLVTMAIASAKLTIFDLSGAGTLLRTIVSFGAVGVCCVAASIFYLVEYGRKHKTSDAGDTAENNPK